MEEKNISDLRAHLFDSIERLKAGQMDVKTAKAVSDLGRTLVETAKVELSYMKHVDSRKPNSAFLDQPKATEPKRLATSEADRIRALYGRAQGVYYVLDEDDVTPLPLESMLERLGPEGLKTVPQYETRRDTRRALLAMKTNNG